jgi:hypothetical protein
VASAFARTQSPKGYSLDGNSRCTLLLLLLLLLLAALAVLLDGNVTGVNCPKMVSASLLNLRYILICGLGGGELALTL